MVLAGHVLEDETLDPSIIDDENLVNLRRGGGSYRSSGGSSSGKSKSKGEGGAFILGVVLIWLAIPATWMNERT